MRYKLDTALPHRPFLYGLFFILYSFVQKQDKKPLCRYQAIKNCKMYVLGSRSLFFTSLCVSFRMLPFIVLKLRQKRVTRCEPFRPHRVTLLNVASRGYSFNGVTGCTVTGS